MKKVFAITLFTLVILAVFATPVYAEDNPALAIKTRFECTSDGHNPCMDEYSYYINVAGIDADMVMAEFSHSGLDNEYVAITTDERGTDGLVSFTVGISSVSGNGKFRVTAFNFDRSTRLIPVIEEDRTGASVFLPIVVK